MKLLGFQYDVQARVEFTRAEAEALVKLAKQHYDAECVAAGLQIGEPHPKVGAGRENGFLTVVLLRMDGHKDPTDTVDTTWPFRYFDITLKILEQRTSAFQTAGGVKERLLYDNLNAKIHKVCDAVQAEHARLTYAQESKVTTR